MQPTLQIHGHQSGLQTTTVVGFRPLVLVLFWVVFYTHLCEHTPSQNVLGGH